MSEQTNNIDHHPDPHHDAFSKTVFGFWVCLMTDFILFGVLFASYAVLKNGTFNGPSACEIFHPTFTLIQTLFLLASAFTVAIANACAHRQLKGWTIGLYTLTFGLGILFLLMQMHEFAKLVSMGYSWKISGFLSAYYTLVGTFVVHIIFGLLWIIVFVLPIFKYGLDELNLKRLTCLKMFWQFLNMVWVFIFTIVYLMGAC